MANEKHDPWALLREARESMGVLVDVGWIPAEMSNVESRAVECIKRIDAALAEHDAVPPSEEKVEWSTGGPLGVESAWIDGDCLLRVRWTGHDALWDATRQGREADEKKAKAAAIAAARGTK